MRQKVLGTSPSGGTLISPRRQNSLRRLYFDFAAKLKSDATPPPHHGNSQIDL